MPRCRTVPALIGEPARGWSSISPGTRPGGRMSGRGSDANPGKPPSSEKFDQQPVHLIPFLVLYPMGRVGKVEHLALVAQRDAGLGEAGVEKPVAVAPDHPHRHPDPG